MPACRRGLVGRSRRRPPSEQSGQHEAAPDQEEEDNSCDSGAEEDLTVAAPRQPDQAQQPKQDPGHFLASFNCAAAICAQESSGSSTKSGSRLKRLDFAVEACLGPGAFHRSKVGLLHLRAKIWLMHILSWTSKT